MFNPIKSYIYPHITEYWTWGYPRDIPQMFNHFYMNSPALHLESWRSTAVPSQAWGGDTKLLPGPAGRNSYNMFMHYL